MMCGMCEKHVNEAIMRNIQAKEVTSSHSKSQTIIQTEENITDEQIKEVISKTGYTVTSINRKTI